MTRHEAARRRVCERVAGKLADDDLLWLIVDPASTATETMTEACRGEARRRGLAVLAQQELDLSDVPGFIRALSAYKRQRGI